MGMVFMNGKTEENMLEAMNSIRSVGMANIIGTMGGCSKGYGKTGKEMERAELFTQMAQ